jgi:hypothetical protein
MERLVLGGRGLTRFHGVASICIAGNALRRRPMGWQVALGLYVLTMVAVVVGVDVAFFKQQFWERLAANVGIVLLFGAFYFRFFRGA